jgi:hypothetical protein
MKRHGHSFKSGALVKNGAQTPAPSPLRLLRAAVRIRPGEDAGREDGAPQEDALQDALVGVDEQAGGGAERGESTQGFGVRERPTRQPGRLPPAAGPWAPAVLGRNPTTLVEQPPPSSCFPPGRGSRRVRHRGREARRCHRRGWRGTGRRRRRASGRSPRGPRRDRPHGR